MNEPMKTSLNRIDGRAKVTGKATYSAEHQIQGLVHGYLVTSTIAKGRIRTINTRAAEKSPGVIAVFTHRNAPKLFKPTNDFMTSMTYESRLPLADDRIHYGGQIIGLVVADTFERARHASHLVEVEYDTQSPLVEPEKATYKEAPGMMGEKLNFEKGSFASGKVPQSDPALTVEATYLTSMEHHAPMEPPAIIAQWRGKDAVTIYEPSQAVLVGQRTYAEVLGLPAERVRLLSPYIGGAFGSKAFPWPHGLLCAAAARQVGKPLKVVVSRRQMTANTGHRSHTEQRIRLSATPDGTLNAIEHEVKSAASPAGEFSEPCTKMVPVMYESPNIRLYQELAIMNVGTPTFMRAPGETPGMWALESAMDELAWKLNIDPIALRLKNIAKGDQRKNLPFSEHHFADCLKVGAERFGWQERQKPRSLTRDGKLVGIGIAAATYPGNRGATSAKVRLLPDGTAHVLTAGNDMGTGAYTVVAMTASEALGLPVEQIRVELGDSRLPDGGIAGGSQMTASLLPAVKGACEKVLQEAKTKNAPEAIAILKESGRAAWEATASTAPGEEKKKYAFHSSGAHFCEVAIDEEIGRLRVTRWLSVMDIGRVINVKTAASQVRGGIIMGISHALMEEGELDPNLGNPVVYDLATYHVASHADIPRIDVAFVGKPDLKFNPVGARGVGEIGITGVAAAVANAVYHATGKRIRDLPITPDKLL
ncbi:xanthine dehydrogenase family protein molybdopterin-binding subunit [Oscillatoria sp. FACHB-1406]|uniref:xanthine dehydrogenase family protein molybdopterin-binding subunit n=1 Tax=Oscillatoria sp. FACHB-1406 TaxID=2692846 RepID=UPI0016829FB3|nr:xanthine dehydrogenase family protein molybdopterin-binding subunit [Oscillatoria sp. FACHB-1406]MBD2580451.1 xanthine dehydrogenase family protein molybdopterin-binding subunit [Oscillatoria sp. FACHB-1406]